MILSATQQIFFVADRKCGKEQYRALMREGKKTTSETQMLSTAVYGELLHFVCTKHKTAVQLKSDMYSNIFITVWWFICYA